jgi:hypothetical protein
MLEPCDEVVVNFQNVINTVDAKVGLRRESSDSRFQTLASSVCVREKSIHV